MPVRIAARSRASAGQCHGRFDWRAGERQVHFPLCRTDLIHGLFGAHVKAMPHLRRVVRRRVDFAGRGVHFGKAEPVACVQAAAARNWLRIGLFRVIGIFRPTRLRGRCVWP